MRQYLALFKVRFNAGLQYRGAALAGVVTQFAWGFLSILLFTAFNTTEMSPENLSTFFWLRQATIALTAIWMMDTSLFQVIESGDVAYECARPTDLYTLWFVRNVAFRCARFVLRAGPIVLVALFLPEPFRMSLPQTLTTFTFFIVSLCMTLLLEISINMFLYIGTMYMKSSLGIRILTVSLFDLLDGSNIPYPFFPKPVQEFFKFTFFYGLQTTPFFIYMGLIQPISAIAIQVVWLVLFVLLGKFLMSKALQRIEVFGG